MRYVWILALLVACGDDGGPDTIEGCEGMEYPTHSVRISAFLDHPANFIP